MQTSTSNYQRAYKACVSCRTGKTKCDLGAKAGPPCLRCQRELRECIFDAERTRNKRRKLNTASPHATHMPSHGTTESDIQHDRDHVRPVSVGTEQAETDSHDLVDSVVRTVVSSGNDALHLLFQAASQHNAGDLAESPTATINPQGSSNAAAMPGSVDSPSSFVPPVPTPVPLSDASPEVLRLWSRSRFVKMGWLSATEAVTFVDLFYRNMAPMTLSAISPFSDHQTHGRLLTSEPLLCSTILMISSRYHVLCPPAGLSRASFIHDRFWKYCQHLIMRLMFGQEKGSTAKTRTLGSVEALLLLCEWHARALHFPPEQDGWDSDILLTVTEDGDPNQPKESPNKWLEDIIEPAQRSDRMSWMLLGCAHYLSQELLVFDDNDHDAANQQLSFQKDRLRKLLFVSCNQFGLRVGYNAVLQQNFGSLNPSRSGTNSSRWEVVMDGWVELTKLLKLLCEMLYSSKDLTRDILHSGRYVGIIEHFQPLLRQWYDRVMGDEGPSDSLQDVLFIEYQYARIYCNSIGMQAVCERAFANGHASIRPALGLYQSMDQSDQKHIEEVISGSCDLLERVVLLAENDALRFASVRVFLRIVTASVFLLKALAIGVRNGQLRSAMNTLDRTVAALRNNVLDDIHLATRYAGLLETHTNRLRHAFLASSTRPVPESSSRSSQDRIDGLQGSNIDSSNRSDLLDSQYPALGAFDNWISLPFDPTMAPLFPCGDTFSNLTMAEGNRLDFLWNLPA